MRNTNTPEFKAKVARELLPEDTTLSQVTATRELHSNVVTPWRDETLAGLSSLFCRTKANEWVEKEAANE